MTHACLLAGLHERLLHLFTRCTVSQSGLTGQRLQNFPENNKRKKNETAPAANHLPDLCRCSNWQLALYWRCGRLLEDVLLSNNVLCMQPRVKQRRCDEPNGEGHILNGMDAFIHRGAPNAEFCHYSTSPSWGKLGFCRLSCGIALPIYRIYRKMDMQRRSRPTGSCEMLQIYHFLNLVDLLFTVT